ncbi:hypothetical protein C5745_10405 [Sphingobacterium haloxyli]|uniref:Uncharacterized protein n=1 Tax=Sphingobacterium haloxyli TaxID=2100533 RepID=A0A2S9J3T5_9SPHI|nr:hypothetical protein C5745_10405 [Sphingobacterium haloxyli]
MFSERKAIAIVVFPFIFLLDQRYKEDKFLLNHENIHIKQATEMLVVPFYIWYFIEFLIRFLQYKKFRQAYLNISFEREAYRNERNLHYLKKRKLWAFSRYF